MGPNWSRNHCALVPSPFSKCIEKLGYRGNPSNLTIPPLFYSFSMLCVAPLELPASCWNQRLTTSKPWWTWAG